ncbi:MAG: hypothetical protein ACLU99_14400 [Alphaproteobacteria bacterium]
MKQFLMLLTVFCLMGWGSSAAAEESEEDIILKYRMAGIKDAKTVEEAFVFWRSPSFRLHMTIMCGIWTLSEKRDALPTMRDCFKICAR